MQMIVTNNTVYTEKKILNLEFWDVCFCVYVLLFCFFGPEMTSLSKGP